MFTRTLAFFAALGTSTFIALPGAAAPASVAHGHVQGRSGAPLAHAFVRQEGGLSASFTDGRGDFSLALDPDAPMTLLVTAPGRIPAEVAVDSLGQPIVLPPAEVVAPPTSTPPLVPVKPALARPIDSSFALRGDYRSLDYVAQNRNSVTGAVDGEVGMNLALRRKNWIVQVDGMRYRPAIRVPSLSTTGTSTFAPEALEGTLALGYLFHPGFDIGPYLVGYGRSSSSFSNGAQYTGTALDWNDSRWSAGVGAQAGGWLYRPWHLEADGRIEGYLLTNDRLSGGAVPAQLSALHGLKGQVQVGWEFMPQVRLQVGYQHELWRAWGYAEDSDIWSVGLGYFPGSPRS